MFIAELAIPSGFPPPKFDLCPANRHHGGAPARSRYAARNEQMNMRVHHHRLRLTETCPFSFQSARTILLERLVSTVGRIHPPPHVEVKVFDLEGRWGPLREGCELCTRGPRHAGLWDEPEKNDTWLDAHGVDAHTGDIAITIPRVIATIVVPHQGHGDPAR